MRDEVSKDIEKRIILSWHPFIKLYNYEWVGILYNMCYIMILNDITSTIFSLL